MTTLITMKKMFIRKTINNRSQDLHTERRIRKERKNKSIKVSDKKRPNFINTASPQASKTHQSIRKKRIF